MLRIKQMRPGVAYTEDKRHFAHLCYLFEDAIKTHTETNVAKIQTINEIKSLIQNLIADRNCTTKVKILYHRITLALQQGKQWHSTNLITFKPLSDFAKLFATIDANFLTFLSQELDAKDPHPYDQKTIKDAYDSYHFVSPIIAP
jgi:hypothetical protein